MYKYHPIQGNLAAPVQLRHTRDGRPVASLRIAVDERRWDSESNQWHDTGKTDFHNVSVWGTAATNAVMTLETGDPVVIIGGKTRTEEYTNSEGEIVQTTSIVADQVVPDLRRGAWNNRLKEADRAARESAMNRARA